MIGKQILHYKILEELGRGGMGVVYRAEDTRLKRQVALKFLPIELTNDLDAKTRFVHEAQAASALDHPNICNIHEIDETKDGQMFLCMTLYDGNTLREKIRQGPLSLDEVIHIAFQIARGLTRAHEANIIHRDLKPANIMMTGHDEVKIVDFGLAKLSGQTDITTAGSPMGTVTYMSPEQAKGEELDAGTDIWSFGIILYELLCGKPPFSADYDQAVVYSILNEEPVPIEELRPDTPKQIINIINRCLKKNREERCQSILDIIGFLQEFVQEITPTSHIYHLPQQIKWQYYLKRFWIPVTAVLLTVILYGIWQLLFGIPEEKHLIVLPFRNISGQTESAIFCDGLLETITSRLGQLKQYNESFEVIPSNIVNRFEIKNADDAYERLGATIAITGSIDRRAEFTQYTLDLIDTRSLRLIDSQDLRIDSANPDVPVEEELIDEIINMLGLRLNEPERAEFFSVTSNRQSAFDFYIRGRGYLDKSEDINNVDTAIRLFNEALDIDSTFTLAYTGIGEAYWTKYSKSMDTSNVKPALAACERATALNGGYAETYVTCGIILNGVGKYEQAINKFQKAISLDPANATAHWKLGQAFWAVGDTSSALKTYQQAIRKRPGYWQSYSHLGVFLLKTGQYEQALTTFQKIVDLLPRNYLGYSYMAATNFYLENFDEALSWGDQAMRYNPSYRTGHNIASFYFYLGKYEQAAAIYRQVLKQNDQDHRIWGALATSYYFTNQPDSARVCYEIAVEQAEGIRKVNPHDPSILVNLAGYYTRLKNSEKAFTLLKEVKGLNPTNLDIFFNIGDVYEQLGERDEALKWMEKALSHNYKLARFTNNPGLKELVADERFQHLLTKYGLGE